MPRVKASGLCQIPGILPAVEQVARPAMSAVPPTEAAGRTAGVASMTARSTGLVAACCSAGQTIAVWIAPGAANHSAQPTQAIVFCRLRHFRRSTPAARPLDLAGVYVSSVSPIS